MSKAYRVPVTFYIGDIMLTRGDHIRIQQQGNTSTLHLPRGPNVSIQTSRVDLAIQKQLLVPTGLLHTPKAKRVRVKLKRLLAKVRKTLKAFEVYLYTKPKPPRRPYNYKAHTPANLYPDLYPEDMSPEEQEELRLEKERTWKGYQDYIANKLADQEADQKAEEN
jgi:hypothetical protein